MHGMNSRDEGPSKARSQEEQAEVDAWADHFQEVIRERGLESAFRSNIEKLTEIASRSPLLFASYLEKWVKNDNSLTNLIKKSLDALSKNIVPWKKNKTALKPGQPVPGVVEYDGQPVKVYRDREFKNWGETVRYTPRFTFVPKTKVGVINIVRFAIQNGLRVRASGSRHSWSDVFGKFGEVCISMMEVNEAVAEGAFSFPKENPVDCELEQVRFEGDFQAPNGRVYGRVRLGASVTSDHFRKWALSQHGGNWQWMLGALPILTEITSAGWTQVICHGAGIRHNSVSDLCIEVEFVNCKGELQVIRDPNQLKAVTGGFGLLGVIVSQVFVLDPLRIAKLAPNKVPTPLAIPPASPTDVPQNTDFSVFQFSDQELEHARKRFEENCHKYYCEWFWFPFQDKCWVNCWDTELPGYERPAYPDDVEVEFQVQQFKLAKIFETTAMRLLPPRIQAQLWGTAAMKLLPSGKSFKASVCDALHFRRGIHLLPVRSCEVQLEIPRRSDGQPDFSVCQKAWWMAIKAVYDWLPRVPMRTTVEMRVVGGSNTILSPQRGNNFGTCSIEVLTNYITEKHEWEAFTEDVVRRWGSLRNPLTGQFLRMKPHFAKEWPRRMRELPVMSYMQYAYQNDIPEFKYQLKRAAKEKGYSLQDAFKVFGNDTILELIGEKPGSATPSPAWTASEKLQIYGAG